MEFPEFADFESFNRTFKMSGVALTLSKISSYIESFNNARMAYLIKFLTNQWPAISHRIGLQAGVRRLIQAKFYKELYGFDPSPDVLQRDASLIASLNLTDIKPEWLNKSDEKQVRETIRAQKKEKKLKQKQEAARLPCVLTADRQERRMTDFDRSEIPDQKVAPKAKKEKPIKTAEELEFSQKVKDMPLDQLISWAKELGIPDEKVAKHKDKPVGLAKMNISNLIRPKLKKS
jgi:uncharacterized HAD superfamily protein